MFYDTYFAKKQIGITLFMQLKSLMPVIIASITMCILVASVYFITANVYCQLIFGLLIGIFSYALICLLFNISDCRIYVKSYLKKGI